MEANNSGTIEHLTFDEQLALLNRTEKRKVLKRYGMLKSSRVKGGSYATRSAQAWR